MVKPLDQAIINITTDNYFCLSAELINSNQKVKLLSENQLRILNQVRLKPADEFRRKDIVIALGNIH